VVGDFIEKMFTYKVIKDFDSHWDGIEPISLLLSRCLKSSISSGARLELSKRIRFYSQLLEIKEIPHLGWNNTSQLVILQMPKIMIVLEDSPVPARKEVTVKLTSDRV
jgi:hypothetical protein